MQHLSLEVGIFKGSPSFEALVESIKISCSYYRKGASLAYAGTWALDLTPGMCLNPKMPCPMSGHRRRGLALDDLQAYQWRFIKYRMETRFSEHCANLGRGGRF
jgi:hypothetical protein